MELTESATVTSKSMVNIPAAIRKRWGIKEGDKLVFLETEDGLKLVRIPPLNEILGSGKEHKEKIFEAIRELDQEHRREAEEESPR